MPSKWDGIISTLVTWIKNIWIDPSNVCWDNLSLIFKAHDNIFLIRFNILQMKFDENVVNPSLFSMQFTLTDNQ